MEIGLTKNDKILHIGCGAYPLTAITIAEQIGAKIVGIDKKFKNVRRAEIIVNKKNLQNKIKIELGNGTDYNFEKFDAIIFSSVVSPKTKILENILKTASSETKIIVRELDLSVDSVKKFIDLNKDKLKLVKTIENHPFPFVRPFGWQSLYMIKK